MHEESIPLTEAGYQKYQEKLHYLKTVRRAQVSERIRQAKEFGDISENAEYESAKNEQAIVEGEILEIEKILRRAHIIRRQEVQTDGVGLGTRVTIENTATGERFVLDIVGSNEVDPANGKISDSSPLGAALKGKKKDEVVQVKTPAGVTSYKILEIGATQ
ncbi:MAG TPA: transcription elongation factor GreA [Candidatus Nitrosotenuis sp.]|jgi:transcription elongation factor GreA|nr:transcription elongation factor GreA [Candidatus Nitrosotenuis sp.]